MKCVETKPFMESRSSLRTVTFLWVEGMKIRNDCPTFCGYAQKRVRKGSQNVHDVLFFVVCCRITARVSLFFPVS